MAPSRRKAAGKAAAAAAAARKWKVGDLVLAKVKGFPAWPATVSEPEKWGYSADVKKVMVYFFGTQQIAFCNPADIQAFTEEKKHSLLSKRHGKGSDFVRALKEIIESYEKLKNQEQADDQKFANDVTIESGRRSAESFQVRENQLVASPDTHLDSDISKGGDKHTLFSEDASAAEQMLALSGNNTSLEQLGDSLTLKEAPKIATYSSRRRHGGLRSQKCPQLKKAPSLQQSKSLSRVDVHRFRSSMFVGGQGLDDMDEGAVRSRKQIRRPSGTPESDDVGLLTSNSNGSGDEDASEIATVESHNSNLNGSAVMDSICRSEDSTKAVVRLEGELEMKKGCDIQIKAIVVKKKRKPKRKRGSSDAADRTAKVSVVAETDAGMSAACHISQNSLEDLRERPSKENGDEHLPLVKRARVRMSRTYADDEVNTSQVEERLSTDTVINELSQAMPPNHDNKPLPDCQSYVENEPTQICLVGSAKSSADFADVLSVPDQKSSGNTSPLKLIVNQFSTSQHDEPIEAEPLAKQFNSKLDDESAFSPPKRAVMEAVSAAVEEAQACSRALSTMNMVINEPDISAAEGTHENDNTLTCLQLCGVNSFANDASEFCVALNSSTSEEPAKKPCAVDESQKRSPGDNMVNSADCHDEKSYHDDSCTVHTGVQFETRGHSPSILSFAPILEKSEADDFQLRQGLGSPCKDLFTSNEISENPARDESNGLLQHGEPQVAGKSTCVTVEPLKPEDGDNSQQNDICKVIAITKDQVQAGNSVSVNDDHSCEKMNISPTDLSGSPVRATRHSTPGCHISTAESANIIQSNGVCTPIEGQVMETGAFQRPKFVGISSNYVEAQNSLQLFEGALGSLVRTKESIARATRLAMDCAKLGVSAKVMEIVANNLENESDLQRRVDSFFLVDSIAQCSRSLKGDSGGPYLSSIQSMLPRLLFAAAPPGATTQENRRQCLKVLRLWLERRILPEYVLCQHIKELDSHNTSLSACLYSRRSARTERAFDDPVRDMEGMLVDEYGSNSTLQLSGLSKPSLLEDEGSDSDGGGFEAVTPEHNSEIPKEHQEQLTASTTERHTHILEEVDGELEMEDVAPSCYVATSTCNNFAQDGNLQTSQNWFGQEHTSTSGHLSQDASSVSPPLPTSPHRHPRAPPPPGAQCAISDSYSNGVDHRGYPEAHGDHLGSASRINLPMATNKVPYPGPELTSSYSNSRSRPTGNIQHNEGSNFQPWHHPPCPPHPPPPPSNHFPYMPPSNHHNKSRRDMHPYSHRSSHYMHNYDERPFNDNHERMRPGPYESRDNRRYPPPSYGSRYHDKPKGPYGQGSYCGPPREPPRFHNQRLNHPPRPFNHHRNSFHYRHHPEGPVSVGMRDPDMWHERW